MRGRRRSYILWAALAFLVGLALVLQISGAFDFGQLDEPPSGHDDALAQLEEQLFAEMRREATLRGVPGIKAPERGVGVLTGTVKLHVAGAGPKPMPGVQIHVLSHGQANTESHVEVETGPDGVFTLPDVPAQVGYVLLVDEAPYRRIVLRGISVRPDQTTNVGTLLLGAPTTLAGEVVDARGRAVAGARVHVLRGSKTSGNLDLRKAMFELQSATSFLAEATASADGKFLVRDLPPGRYVLRVSAPGYATSFTDNVLVTADENSSAARVVLDPGSGFYGRVLDENNRGVADARVIALAVPGEQLNRFDRIDVRTDADGSYRLDTLISGMNYAAEAWAPGYAPTGKFPLRASGMREQDFHLVRSGRIEGRVTDEDTGEGIPDVQVSVVAGKLLVGMSPVATVTDETGGFVLPHVNPGPVIVFSAKAEGYQPGDKVELKAVNGFKVTAGETTWIDWTLKAGGAVYGRITTDGGRPVAYASLSLIDRKKGRQRWTGEVTAMTDTDGNYELIGVRPGTYDLHVNAAGYAPLSGEENTKVVMGGDLGRLPKDVTLERGGVLVGVITAPDDTPVRGARIWLEGTKRGHVPSGVRDLAAVSGGAGRFRIQGVPPGMHVVVVAEHDSFVAARSAPQRLSAGQERQVAIKLGKGVSLPGRAVDSRGNAIAGAHVRWGNIDGVRERDLRQSFRADGHLGPRVLRTDVDGRFLIERLPAGKLLVKIEHPDFAAWYRKDLLIAPGESAQPAITAEMEATLTVSGRVTGGDSEKPLQGAIVYARERGPLAGQPPDPGRVQAVVSAETDETGAYVLTKLPPGTHEIVVYYAEGYIGEGQNHRNPKVRRKGVVAGASGVDFALDPVVPPETEGD